MTPIDTGTWREFCSYRPHGSHRRRWRFRNDTGYDWTNIYITCLPDGLFDFPPQFHRVQLRAPKAVGGFSSGSGTSSGRREYHETFPNAVEQGETLEIEISFDRGWEEDEYLEITFSHGADGTPVPGVRVTGEVASRRTAAAPRPQGDALAAIDALHRKVRDLNAVVADMHVNYAEPEASRTERPASRGKRRG